MSKMETTKGQLIVSCQALPNEPLHSSFIMGRMAKAAKEGGAKGIRANTVADIKEIKEQVDLPVIGIIKREYGDNPVYITPTMKEIDELMEVKPDVIAVDATCRQRPDGKSLDEFVNDIVQHWKKCYTQTKSDSILSEQLLLVILKKVKVTRLKQTILKSSETYLQKQNIL